MANGGAKGAVVGGRSAPEVGRLFAGFTAYAEPFRSVVTGLGGARTAADPRSPAASAQAPESPAGTGEEASDA